MLPETLQHIAWLPTGAYDNMNNELPKSGGICLTLSSDVGVIVDEMAGEMVILQLFR